MAGQATKQPQPLRRTELSAPRGTPEPTSNTAVLTRQASVTRQATVATRHTALQAVTARQAVEQAASPGPVDVTRQATEYKSDPKATPLQDVPNLGPAQLHPLKEEDHPVVKHGHVERPALPQTTHRNQVCSVQFTCPQGKKS